MVAAQRGSWLLSGATVAAVAALYLPCVQKAVPGGDSGELITAACELGVAHPPGYPLFTLLSSLAMTFLPSVSPAHSVNLLSGLLGSMASGTLCFTVCRLAGPGPGAVLAGGVFALSLLTWRWSVVAEVFSLNNLFVGSILALAASFHRADGAGERRKFSRWGALCCGLGLCNQHTLVLYVVPVIPWVLLRLHTYQELSLRGAALLALHFLFGFLPYLYLPISSAANAARWSWGDQTTVRGLLTHLLRMEYGTFSLAKADGSVGSARMLRAQLDHCVAHLTVPVLILAGISLLLSLWDRRQYVLPWLLAAMVLLYSLFFAWRANLDISRPLLLGVVERFWLQGDAVLCVLSGLGLAGLCAALERWLARGTLWTACAWALTAGLLAHLARSNYRECDQSRNDVVERFARGILDSMPQDSLLLTRGDLPGNSLRYLHYCQGLRPDLRLVDQEMMTYGWYVAKLGRHHPGVRFPGRRWDPARAAEEDAFGLERFLRHNSDRDVFACIGLPEGDPGWMRSFSRWPWGICEQLVPAETRLQPEAWARRTRSLYNWTEPHDSFRAGSWEKVANEEMWQARMKTAFFLFDVAEKVPEEGKERLFELSYTLYKEIVDAHENHPSNWDKNLALAGERLLRYGGRGHDPDRLLAQTIESFSLYLEKEPADPKAEAIRSVISHLRKERQRLRRSRHAT
ncbi:transmembrane protein 260-like isoform X1 [Scleropages formosus]|uniref:transmembrane protein 260-like isoform X1 n=2 Tax=Scleropages formosus TaxID=113540 RepID=UPI0010FACD4B|nr:transmembrane protein 260 isoform X1 [Scleropages formosus]XP_029114417.1 transmembrane protein 260 isoform X1 [Scleropages formosus]XP_029114418.1 transmembrane protein 260 isoform X1 [Scleropages formosus]XP_029114419.1 transmembrane protein 260 isoform X1 [Scleropages formosus]